MLAVCPELSCAGKPYVSGEFCLGSEETFAFLENVLTEVTELFPSEYIHIGGDEVSGQAWASCPKCRARMEREGLGSAQALQAYAVRRIGRFLEARGRKLIGWDEILDSGPMPGAAVMSWRGEEGGRRAAALGHDVIMCPGSHCYFDGFQDNPEREPQAFTGYLPLSKVYSYDPAPAALSGREHIIGVQANLWTEYIPTPSQAEYMLYPRMFALAEVAWSAPETKDYADFRRRALRFCDRARRQGYHTFDLRASSASGPNRWLPSGTLPSAVRSIIPIRGTPIIPPTAPRRSPTGCAVRGATAPAGRGSATPTWKSPSTWAGSGRSVP